VRSTPELEALAHTFKQDWVEGDRVLTWITRHEGRAGTLTALIVDGWSWVDVGRAMQLAGISYRPGVAIDGVTLRHKAYQARKMVRARLERGQAVEIRASGVAPDTLPSIAFAAKQARPPLSYPPEQESRDRSPRFRPVRFRDPPPPHPEPKPHYPPLPLRQTVDAETAIARMFGRPLPKRDDG
jgi:hypothetical protein